MLYTMVGCITLLQFYGGDLSYFICLVRFSYMVILFISFSSQFILRHIFLLILDISLVMQFLHWVRVFPLLSWVQWFESSRCLRMDILEVCD